MHLTAVFDHRRDSSEPPERCRHQLTMLAHMKEFACRLAALEVSGVAPIPTPCSSILASRKSSSPALHEARTLLGAGAGFSRIRLPAKPTRAVPPDSDVLPRQPLGLDEVVAKLAAVLDKPRSSRSVEEEFGVDTPRFPTAADQEGGGLQRLAMPRCSAFYAPVTNTLELSLRSTR